MSHTALLNRAALIIEMDAESLKQCHTVNGRWTKSEAGPKREWAEMVKTAKELRKAAAYFQAAPLGGQAKVFDACADAIRAGEPMDKAMRLFGLKFVKTAASAAREG